MNTRHSLLLAITSLASLGLFSITGCSSASSDENASSGEAEEELSIESEGFHAMPIKGGPSAGLQTTAAPKANVTYRGGKVIPSVQLVSVFWGKGVQYEGEVDDFYATVTQSSYFDWVYEYSTPKQWIGRGNWIEGVPITPSTKATRVSDKAIQKEISKQIGSHVLPAPDGVNTMYMVHFPPGVTIAGPSGDSCSAFCAYHGAFKRSGKMVYYGVFPDFGSGGCENVCGAGSAFDNLTEAASHELMEAVTDAVPGKGWYDDKQGEIGDICAYRTTKLSGFTVQLEWSQRQGACVAAPQKRNGGPN